MTLRRKMLKRNGQTAGLLTVAFHLYRRHTSAAMRKISNDWNQVRGGARDWKKACCGGTKTAATRSKCSISREARSAGTCGACGTNELAARWIVAQIAQ